MNREDQPLKPIMQIIFGIGLFVISSLMNKPISIVEKYKHSHSYNPNDELFLYFVKWASLISSFVLIMIGLLGIIRTIKKRQIP